MVEFNNVKLNTDLMSCSVNDEEVNLTRNEYNLLLYLFDNKNKITTREDLAHKVWKKETVGRTIDTTISRLRKKLGNSGNYIITKPGVGYALID